MSKDRYLRQTLIKDWDQDKIRGSTASIVGLGALGSVIATSLALAGVGHLKLIDYDTVEISNLNRQLLFNPADVGKPKVTVAADAIRNLNREIQVDTFNHPVEEIPKQELRSSTVLIEGLDTFASRRWINAFAISAKIPLVSGGIYGFLGNVQVIIPFQTACLDCQSLIPEEELQKACTPFGTERKISRPDEEIEEDVPSVSSVSFVIGGLMAQEALKVILGIPPMEAYFFWDGRAGAFTSVPLKRREDCFICSTRFQLEKIRVRSPKNQTLKEFIQQLRYAFNLGDKSAIMIQTSTLPISDTLIGEVFKSGDTFRVIDPVLTIPLKFTIQLD
ncbi:MAG: ThiF family adenylyltransferase [Candidatus Heimdallarchaeota archaeon]